MQPIKSFIGVGLLLVATSSAYAATDSSGVWTTCASERGTCTISGTQAVRYGASGKYATGTFKDKVSCSNAVFGDPVFGVTKQCEVLTPTQAPSGYEWKNCGKEWGASCTPSGIQALRYGADGKYFSGTFKATTICGNSVFGDPIPGVAKNCDVLSPVTPPVVTWTKCASEFDTCKFDGTKTVKYGANDKFVTGTYTGSVSCGNAVFGDPIAGVNKACFVSSAVTTNVPPPVTWTKCASEFETCKFDGTKTVKYGANDKFVTGTYTGSVSCGNAVFGDPIAGVNKACFVSSAVTTSPVVTAPPPVVTAPAPVVTPPPSPLVSEVCARGTVCKSNTVTTDASWTRCAKSTACKFTGVRDLVYVSNGVQYPTGRWNKQAECSTMWMNIWATVKEGAGDYCLVSPEIAPLAVAAKPTISSIPPVNPGTSRVLTRMTNVIPSVNQGSTAGEFRLSCDYSHFNYDDPIRFPNVKGAAGGLMSYFGNVGIDFSTTNASTMTSGNSTCQGGILNRTAYFMPAMVDTRSNKALAPTGIMVYYKTGYIVKSVDVTPIPEGLRMFAGMEPVVPGINNTHIKYSCRLINDDGNDHSFTTIPPDCKKGDMYVSVAFPQCWDGVNLDSPDHKAHMAYTTNSGCPATHPIVFPRIDQNIHYNLANDGDSKYLRLSTDAYSTSVAGGLSGYAGWINGWDKDTMNLIVKGCLNTGFDCQSNRLPDGRELMHISSMPGN